MFEISKTDERMIVDVCVAGYKNEDVKIKSKVDDKRNVTIVVDVKASSSDEKFGVYKHLNGFKDEIPVNKEVYDIDKLSAVIQDNGVLRISIPKKDEFVSKVLVNFGSQE